ncbi:uncharacterized protein [Salvelinus alpinus]|uniref:uncharacterized protein isoform X1 n=1 Tax=Salvelinus alpinus TaxID=8036 RepID=UPI0039FC3927
MKAECPFQMNAMISCANSTSLSGAGLPECGGHSRTGEGSSRSPGPGQRLPVPHQCLRWHLPHDTTRTQHTSRLCKGYLTKKESDGVLHQMTWPPQSPDHNPIEMVWDELDRTVKEKQPTRSQHMWELLQDCWKSIQGAFADEDIVHVEGNVDPVRDIEIIHEELRLKDEEMIGPIMEKLEKVAVRGSDKKLKPEYDVMLKIKNWVADERKHVRYCRDWTKKEIEVLNKYLFLTSKPMIYLINLSEKDYIRRKNKWLVTIKSG